MEDQNTFVASCRDLSRQDAADNDTDFSLSLEEVAERYERAGHPRTLRSLQRYCASGHLDARKIATTMGDKYIVTPLSVARHIAQIVEFSQLDAVATGRDMSRPVATTTALEESMAAITPENGSHNEPDKARQAATDAVAESPMHPQEPQQEAATGHDSVRQAATETVPPVAEAPVHSQDLRHEPTTSHDMSRPVAASSTATGETSRYVAQLEHQLEIAHDERDFLREQINRKDRTIEALIERDRETNYLVRGLQEMLTPLLPSRRQAEPPTHTQ